MDGELHKTIIEIDLGGERIIARASSERKNSRRWTVLTIYRLPRDRALHGISGAYVSEIVGETRVSGELRRVRRSAFTTLAKALNWGAWDHQTDLYHELRQKAVESFETVTGPDDMTARNRELSPSGTNFDGTTFREALAWLYEHPDGLNDLSAQVRSFVADWGCENPEVEDNITAADVATVLEMEDELGVPAWAETFVRAMRHFRREEFHAARVR